MPPPMILDNYRPKAEKPVVLLVEGRNPLEFIKRVFREQLNRVEIVDYGSKDKLSRGVTLVSKASGFREYVRRIGVIRDAEADTRTAIQSVQSALQGAKLPVPPRPAEMAADSDKMVQTAFLIMPTGEDSGCFEHALLAAFADAEIRRCADAFLKCVPQPAKAANWALDNWLAKAKVHALIAVSKKPEHTLGESGEAKLWDKSRPSLKVVGEFLDLILRDI